MFLYTNIHGWLKLFTQTQKMRQVIPKTRFLIYKRYNLFYSTDIKCEGSLISDRYILTAASCVQKIPDFWKISKVRLGDWNLMTNPDCEEYRIEPICNEPYLEIPVEKFIVHDEYDRAAKNQHNDIALLKLEHKIEYNEWIGPICMPTNKSFNLTRQDTQLMGFLPPESNEHSKHQIDIEVMAKDKCQKFYSDQNITVSDYQICGVVNNRHW